MVQVRFVTKVGFPFFEGLFPFPLLSVQVVGTELKSLASSHTFRVESVEGRGGLSEMVPVPKLLIVPESLAAVPVLWLTFLLLATAWVLDDVVTL